MRVWGVSGFWVGGECLGLGREVVSGFREGGVRFRIRGKELLGGLMMTECVHNTLPGVR